MSIISKDIQKAITLLTNDELVAIPTETVYGLAGNIFSEKAIHKIFATKKRPFFNPLIVHVASVNALKDIVAEIPEKAMLLAEAFWPGSMTLVLKKSSKIPDLITASKDTVAVRVPNHVVTLELLEKLPFPLAAPSANPFGSISPTKPLHVENYFKEHIKMVLDGGNCKNGIESTIIGFENDNPIIYRLGALAVEDIEAVVGKISIKNKEENSPDAPGMLARHYAPTTKTILVTDVAAEVEKNKGKKIGILVFKDSLSNDAVTEIVLSNKGLLEEAAANLYDAMHALDHQNLEVIIAEKLPNYGLGKSMNDRLQRATFSV
ncbi:L-threonylcarbamoyladenylate synthase [uncultured Polaribacter sp.]|uniref:L-threonylcarbamoyladenylate synthase n=1 Tax=uncultured Polaribacter sp. TaxID=174711 RepID=UPI00260A594B|nr:L-threonylcarbamoyladenylate synthase [uncultured Polaribacter sp.]